MAAVVVSCDVENTSLAAFSIRVGGLDLDGLASTGGIEMCLRMGMGYLPCLLLLLLWGFMLITDLDIGVVRRRLLRHRSVTPFPPLPVELLHPEFFGDDLGQLFSDDVLGREGWD